MIALSRMPMFGFAVLAFLLLCAVLAFAVWFATRGAVEPGRSRVSGPAGCAIGCALLVMAGLGTIATVAVVVVNLPDDGRWIRHVSTDRIELGYELSGDEGSEVVAPERGEISATRSFFAEIELRPGADAGPVLSALRRQLDAGVDATVRSVTRDGTERTVIGLTAPEDEAARRALGEALRRLELPKDDVLEVRGP